MEEESARKTFKYDAFISYRHTEPDRAIAERLQKMLEGYKAPKGVAGRYGLRSIRRVFRDRDELPTSGNLYEDIEEALASSRCLIAVCSPRMPKSLWCRKEIETFRRLHGNDGILALLIEGEPHESFPEELRFITVTKTDETGAVQEETVEAEPLAADIRASSLRKSLRLLNRTEKLRLLAPMLGCEFAELTRRQRERRLKRIVAAALAAAAVSLAVGAVILGLLLKLDAANGQLVSKNNVILTNNSDYLADEATRLYQNGDRLDALLVAMEALPKDLQNPDRPLVAKAENALAAIYNSDSYGTAVLDTEGIPVNVLISPDGRYLVSEEQEADNQRAFGVWEVSSGRFVAKLKNVPAQYNNAGITADSKYVVIRDLYWDISTGNLLGRYEDHGFDGKPGTSASRTMSPAGRYWVDFDYTSGRNIHLTDRKTGRLMTIAGGENRVLVFFAGDTRLLVQTSENLYGVSGWQHTGIYDTSTGAELTAYGIHVGYSYTCTSPDGRYTALQVGGGFVICNTADMSEVAHSDDVSDNTLFSSNLNLFGPRAFFSNDGSLLAFQAQNFTQLMVWDWKRNELKTWYPMENQSGTTIPHAAPGGLTLTSSYCETFVDDPLFSPDDKKLLTVQGYDVRVNDLASLSKTGRSGYFYDTFWNSSRTSVMWSTIRDIIPDTIQASEGSYDIANLRGVALRGDTDAITCARFFPDGNRILTASKDKTIRLWDTARLPSDQQYDYEHAFGSIWKDVQTKIGDNRLLAPTDETRGSMSYLFMTGGSSSSADADPLRAIALRDASTGREIAEIQASVGYISRAFPMPGGGSFGTVSTSNVVDVWNMQTGARVNEVNAGPTSLVSPGGSLLALVDDAHHLQILGGDHYEQTLVDEPLAQIGVPDATDSPLLFWLNSGKTLGIARGARFYAYSVAGGKLSAAYPALELVAPGGDVSYSVQGDSLIAACNPEKGGSYMVCYDLATGRETWRAAVEGSVQRMNTAASSLLVDTRTSAGASYDSLYVFDKATGKQISCTRLDNPVRDMVTLPDGTLLAAQADGTLLKLEPSNGSTAPLSVRVQNDFMNVFDQCSADSRYVTLLDDKNGTQSVYDMQRDAVVARYSHADNIIYSPDGKGYYVYERSCFFYCPFLTTSELMEKVRQELVRAGASLTPGQKEKYFVE